MNGESYRDFVARSQRCLRCIYIHGTTDLAVRCLACVEKFRAGENPPGTSGPNLNPPRSEEPIVCADCGLPVMAGDLMIRGDGTTRHERCAMGRAPGDAPKVTQRACGHFVPTGVCPQCFHEERASEAARRVWRTSSSSDDVPTARVEAIAESGDNGSLDEHEAMAREILHRRMKGRAPAEATSVCVPRETVVWADDATPFTGPQVLDLLRENEAMRKAPQLVRWAVWRLRTGTTSELVAAFRHRDHAATWAAKHYATDETYVEKLDDDSAVRGRERDPLGPLQELVDLAEKTNASVKAAVAIAAETPNAGLDVGSYVEVLYGHWIGKRGFVRSRVPGTHTFEVLIGTEPRCYAPNEIKVVAVGDPPAASLSSCPTTEGVHELKTWPQFYQAVVEGRKTFEVRKNDRGFRIGDKLVLCEWAPERGYTGRWTCQVVTYLVSGAPFLPEDTCVMGIEPSYLGDAYAGKMAAPFTSVAEKKP